MWRFLTTLFPCLLACFFLTGQAETSQFKTTASSLKAANDVKLSEGDNGKEVTIKIGDILQIELKRSGGTGYEWYLDKSYKKYFELVKEETETGQSRGLVGTPVVRTWKLRAIGGGEAEIRLFLYRDWEDKDKAGETFKIKVRIL